MHIRWVVCGVFGALQYVGAVHAAVVNEERIKAFEAQIVPGRYRVDDFRIDERGVLIKGTVKTREYCLLRKDVSALARAPLVLGDTEPQCELIESSVSSDDLIARWLCVSGRKSVVRGISVFVKPESKQVGTLRMNVQQSTSVAGKDHMVFGAESIMTWQGMCP